MNELTFKILLILLIIALSPLSYIYAYFIIELPKKYGYWKFSLIVLCYLLIIAVDTYLLSMGILGLLIFFLVPIFILLIGAYYFRNEIIEDMKKSWENLKKY